MRDPFPPPPPHTGDGAGPPPRGTPADKEEGAPHPPRCPEPRDGTVGIRTQAVAGDRGGILRPRPLTAHTGSVQAGLPSWATEGSPPSTSLHPPTNHKCIRQRAFLWRGFGCGSQPRSFGTLALLQGSNVLGFTFVFSKDHHITPLRNVFVEETLVCGAVIF